MWKYIKESFNKFKNDALSKGVYDIFKSLIKALIIFLMINWIPWINEALLTNFQFNWYKLILLSFILIIVSVLITNVIYRGKIKKLIEDHSIDKLTGLKNETGLNLFLVKSIQESVNMEEPLSLILIDIDDFKKWNETLGYINADKIISKVGEYLKNDNRITDQTYRYHRKGDEFLIVAKTTNLSEAEKAAERKRKNIQKMLIEVDGTNHQITISCGITELNRLDSLETFISRTEKALFEAKMQNGKNCTKTII